MDITTNPRHAVFKTDKQGRPIERLGAIHPNEKCLNRAADRYRVQAESLWMVDADTVALAQKQWVPPAAPSPSIETRHPRRGPRIEFVVPEDLRHAAVSQRATGLRRESPNRRHESYRSSFQP